MQNRFFNKQIESIKKSNARLNIWEGPVRSGKTIASLFKWIHFCKYGPKYGNFAMVGKTERTLKHNIIDPLKDILGNSCRYNQGKGELYIGKRKTYIFGANDRRSEEKIRGGTWAGCYGDELTLWPEEVFKMALSRMSVDNAQFFGTTNTDSPFHWLKTDYLDREDSLDLISFHFNLEDNIRPEGFLDVKFVNNLKKEYTGLWYKRFILGLWVLADGSIYDMFDDDVHVQDCKISYRNYIVGIDYGTANPCTFGLYGYNDLNKIYLISEYYYDSKKSGKQKTDIEYARDFSKWLNKINIHLDRIQAIYIDPTAASFRSQMKSDGWNVKDADNSVIDGIRFVSSLIENDKFIVNSKCKETIKEFSSYIWDVNAQKRGEDRPLKENDHTMDRNRYALYTHFGPKKRNVGLWGSNEI